MEYRPSRPLFFRDSGDYRTQTVYDPEAPPLLCHNSNPCGDLAPSSRIGASSMDRLISFEPNPGIIAFFGEGARRTDPERTSLAPSDATATSPSSNSPANAKADWAPAGGRRE